MIESANKAIPLIKATFKKSFPKHIIELIQLKDKLEGRLNPTAMSLSLKINLIDLQLLPSEIKKYKELKLKRFI